MVNREKQKMKITKSKLQEIIREELELSIPGGGTRTLSGTIASSKSDIDKIVASAERIKQLLDTLQPPEGDGDIPDVRGKDIPFEVWKDWAGFQTDLSNLRFKLKAIEDMREFAGLITRGE